MTSDIVMKYGITPIRRLAFLLAVSALSGTLATFNWVLVLEQSPGKETQ